MLKQRLMPLRSSPLSKLGLVFAVPLMMSALPAQAQPGSAPHVFSYSYGQLAVERWDYDQGLDVDAVSGDFSLDLDSNLFARASLGLYDGDADEGWRKRDTDGHRISVGLGFHTPLAQRLDFVASGDIIRDDHDRDDDFGFALRGGIRHATTDRLELAGGLFYEELYDSEVGVYGEALFRVTRPIDVGARVNVSGDYNSLGVFARYNFF